MKRIALAAVSAVLLTPAAFALDVDWNRDPVAQIMKAAKPSLKTPPPAAVAPEAPIASETLAYFKGTMKLKGETHDFCFSLSPEKVDAFEGDPDVSQGVFVSQAIPSFHEDGSKDCATALDHNGGTIRTCGGLYMTDAPSLSKGDVFTTLARFDPNTGALSVQPVGSYEMRKVGTCGVKDLQTDSAHPNKAFPIDEKSLREVAVLMADQANAKDGQVMVGELVSYSCTASKDSASARCAFKYALDRSICWFGYENLSGDLSLKQPRDVSNVERHWTRD